VTVATTAAAPVASTAPASSAVFSKFVDDYFDARFAYLPSQGTDAGFHQYDARLEDRSGWRQSRQRPINWACP